MKRKLFIALLLGVALLLVSAAALAADDLITGEMEISPNQVTGLQTIDVTIKISNTSSDATPIAVVLNDPTSNPVADFGTGGEVQLAGGESKTWQGKWDVQQTQLNTGYVYYYVVYTAPGETKEQRRALRASITKVTSVSDAEVKRTISPSAAREGQKVTIKYDIVNTGTVAMQSITIQENSSISKKQQTIDSIAPGAQAEVKFEVTMGTKDLTSSATVTYKTEGSSKTQTQEIEAATITYGEPKLSVKLTASAKGVEANGKVTLTLDMTNKGNIDYTGITVTDPTLGEVFSNQQLAAGQSISLSKEVTVTATTEYQFTVNAVDNTGTEVSPATDLVKVTVIDPSMQAHLTVTVTPDRTDVYESPGLVRFSIKIENDGPVDVTNVDVTYGSMKLYTFATIPMGETRSMTRDAALSQAGKYRFTATTTDEAGITTSFDSNDINIAFNVPTPAPATATPPPVPTAVPTFQPSVMPSITDPTFSSGAKLARSILLALTIIGALLLLGGVALKIVAASKRKEQQRASDAAYDHLERVRRRDYRTPGEPDEVEVAPLGSTQNDPDNYEGVSRKTAKELKKESAQEQELPHMKYVRNALELKSEAGGESTPAKTEPFDLNSASFADIYRHNAQSAKSYADDYGTSFEDDGYGTASPDETAQPADAYGANDGYADYQQADAQYPQDESSYTEPQNGYAQQQNDGYQPYDDQGLTGGDSQYGGQPYDSTAYDDQSYGEAPADWSTDAYTDAANDGGEGATAAYDPNDGWGEETVAAGPIPGWENEASADAYGDQEGSGAEPTNPNTQETSGRHRRARGEYPANTDV